MDLHIHENTLVKFDSSGMIISAGLNVSPEIAFVLTYHNLPVKGKVFRGNKMQIYKKARHIESRYICQEQVLHVQRQIILEVQADIKLAKQTLNKC